MKEETAVAFLKEAWQDVKSGVRRCAGALEGGWDGLWANIARHKKEHIEAEERKPDAVRVAELKEQTVYVERTRHPLGGTIQFVALLGFLAFLIGLLFLPMEIAGSVEGDLKLDTQGSGMAFQTPEGLYRYDYLPDERWGIAGSHILDMRNTSSQIRINKSLSIYVNGGQGTLRGTYSIKAPSIIAVAWLFEVDRITASLERLRP